MGTRKALQSIKARQPQVLASHRKPKEQ